MRLEDATRSLESPWGGCESVLVRAEAMQWDQRLGINFLPFWFLPAGYHLALPLGPCMLSDWLEAPLTAYEIQKTCETVEPESQFRKFACRR